MESLKCWICLMTGREDKLFLAFGLSVSVGAGTEMGWNYNSHYGQIHCFSCHGKHTCNVWKVKWYWFLQIAVVDWRASHDEWFLFSANCGKASYKRSILCQANLCDFLHVSWFADMSHFVAISLDLSCCDIVICRELQVPESCNGVARFTFEQVCDRPVSYWSLGFSRI